ncbi:MAG: CCA tRNA nucleotidyltransferase [Candidatus Methylomirabilales bacterium]
MIRAARVLGEGEGVSVYLVGGPVRDLILGRPTADLDLAVAGDAVAFAKGLAAHLETRATVHPRFGTATLILPDGLRLDVAAARREVYPHPAALPQVEPGTIWEDLFRRDFSINAMALRVAPRGGGLLDPFGGVKDLTGGLLRALHPHSYRDDPTRIFRGARYGARYRLRFSARDRRRIRSVLAETVLRRLSKDRLFRELTLVLGEPAPEAALKILQNLGVLTAIDAALALAPGAVTHMRRVRRAWQRLDRLAIAARPPLWRLHLLVLLLSVPPRVRRRVATRLGVHGSALDAVMRELSDLPLLEKRLEDRRLGASRLRHLLDRVSVDLRILLLASQARRVRDRVERYLTCLASVKPALTGQDLRKFGFPPGPAYRRILDLLLEGRLEGCLKSRDDEINFVQQRFGRRKL